MHVITAITGQVGGAVARTLLEARQPVRAVVRDARKGQAWAQRGCQLALADMQDAAALTTAFAQARGVFILLPPNFDPSPGFPESRAIIAAIRTALTATRPEKVVCLSTIGAQAKQPNLLSQLTILQEVLGETSLPVTFLRPGWFMENFAWDIPSARTTGVISSFLQPLEKTVPMVATADVGRVAAELLMEKPNGQRVVELAGPQRVSPNEVATTFSRLLHRPVRMEAVPRQTWSDLFLSQGMRFPESRMRMLDGFNEGWIEFAGSEANTRKGKVTLTSVLEALIAKEAHS